MILSEKYNNIKACDFENFSRKDWNIDGNYCKGNCANKVAPKVALALQLD